MATHATSAASPIRGGDEPAPCQGVPWCAQLQNCGSRAALAETAEGCLAEGRRWLYAVHRPFSVSGEPIARPEDYVALVTALSTVGLTATYGARVAEVLTELLQKPLHPQHGVLTPWDIPEKELVGVMAKVVDTVTGAMDGSAALSWLETVLQVSREDGEAATTTAATSTHPSGPLVEVVGDRITGRNSAVRVAAPHGDALLGTPTLMAAVAASLIRCDDQTSKQSALHLLELALITRLNCGSGGGGSGSALGGAHRDWFSEDVVVRCAEAAAQVGDPETVTRLMFLLYRARGALGYPGIDPAVEEESEGFEHVGWYAGWMSTAASARRGKARWTSRRTTTPTAQAGQNPDTLFERASLRLLQSATRAALHSSATTGVREDRDEPRASDAQLEEGLSLFDALRGGTSWAGVATMAVELLTFIAARQQQCPAASLLDSAEDRATATYLQASAVRVLAILVKAAGTHSEGREDIVATCVELVMRTFVSYEPLSSPSSSTLLPVVRGVAADGGDEGVCSAARVVLWLFGLVLHGRHKDRFLPYAMAAATTLLFHTHALEVGPFPTWFPTSAVHLSPYGVSSTPDVSSGDSVGPVVRELLTVIKNYALMVPPKASPKGGSLDARRGGLLLSLAWTLVAVGHRRTSTCSYGYGTSPVFEASRDWLPAPGVEQGWLRAATPSERDVLCRVLLSLTSTQSHASLAVWQPAVFSLAESILASLSPRSDIGVRDEVRQTVLKDLLALLYRFHVCGTQAVAVVDRALSNYLGFTVRASLLSDVVEAKTQRPADATCDAVVVVSSETLRKENVRWGKGEATDSPWVSLDSFEADVVSPLLSHRPAARVVFLLPFDAIALLEEAVGHHSGTPTPLITEVLQVLRRDSPPSSAATVAAGRNGSPRVRIAAAFPLPVAPVMSRGGGGGGASGVREAYAVARFSRQNLPPKQRPAVFLWSENDALEQTEGTAWKQQLADVGVRLLSLRRAHVERAKQDIVSLLRQAGGAQSVERTPTSARSSVAPRRSAPGCAPPPSSSLRELLSKAKPSPVTGGSV